MQFFLRRLQARSGAENPGMLVIALDLESVCRYDFPRLAEKEPYRRSVILRNSSWALRKSASTCRRSSTRASRLRAETTRSICSIHSTKCAASSGDAIRCPATWI